MMPTSLRILVFSFLVNFLYFLSIDSKAAQKTQDAYVTASIGDARVLIPIFADDTASSAICSLVYNGLTKVDKNLDVVGDLAERWEVSPTGLVITFHLRKNARWHDGAPFTADDVKFTFERILDPEVGCPYISGYTEVSKIEAIDPYTVSFTYKKPYAPALLKLGMGIIPKHIFEKEKNIRASRYARSPVGTGPYRFSRWETGQYIILEANPDYFDHPPGIKKFVYSVMPDQAIEFLELLAGGIDSMDLNPYQFRFRSLSERFRAEMNKYKYLAHSYTYIGYNLKDPILSDKRVRQALSYAINKNEIIDSALLGLGEVSTGPFLRDSIYYNEDVKLYEYDPEKSKMLLRRAGWEDVDSDGILEKDKTKFKLTIVTNQGNSVREDVATIVQRQWAEVGVKADIEVVAWAAFLDQFISKKNFQATILAWSLPVDPDCYAIWHSESAKEGGLNSVSYSNKRVDELIEKGTLEFDPEKRKEIYHEIHSIIAEDAPYTFLFFSYAMPAVHKRFRGIEAASAGIYYNFIDWYVDEREVKYRF